ncbi:MAG: uroporphyrinogen-III C-methyltransferase [Clostridiales bacterium]|nr:uroporphyrinogen-III C-methyltransferase [Clostridiales bacterium]
MVYIIGAGPGDEELLTLKAIKALKRCTAVLYDRLISNNILNYLDENCQVYYCGKEPGNHYKTQDEINEMIVKLAKDGHVVGRIKGGDPYVFGRGGEEALALVHEGIEFQVIPGVTSPISVLNYAGIPITYRNIAQSFHIITGMTGDTSNINYKALSQENGTLVFMMGLSNLNNIVKNLINNGKDINTKVAVIMQGTTAKQKKVEGTLKNIVEKVELSALTSPCIIVIGEVVRFSKELCWYEKLPLFGVNICITRSRKQSVSLKEKLVDLGAEVTEFNSIKIQDMSHNFEEYLDRLKEYNHILFTSANGVNTFFDYLLKKQYDIRNIKANFYVIGNATSKALMNRGIIPKIVAKEFHSDSLLNDIKTHVRPKDKLFYLTSAKAQNNISQELSNSGIIVDKIPIYDTVCGKIINSKSFEKVDVVFFTSPSTVRNMITLVGVNKIKEKKVIAIGPITLKELENNNINAIMCKKHSEEGFLEDIVNLIKEV